ncbi:MAG: 3-isopropylmalate dehydratase small subunit [Planctomycetes bacterium RBG_16_59_8]|nr:MAG: 3-isopropylmalate dehydratase small subunit [Planctomycetes bacterium RBG_16_59_8]
MTSNAASFRGKGWKYGANIDTDVIIPGRYCHISDEKEIAKHCMEDLDPQFLGKMRSGDVIIAGSNFGCGSSRELAPIAIKAAGISCVVAESFARIFYRNAINIGLPIVESPEAVAGIGDGEEVEIDIADGVVKNLSRGGAWKFPRYPEFIQRIVDAGGLLPYIRKYKMPV